MTKSAVLASVALGVSAEAYPLLYDFLDTTAQAAGMDTYHARRLRLAVEEAVGNIIDFSSASEMTLAAAVSGNQLTVTVSDNGQPFDPTAYADPDLSRPADERRIGGLGIFYMRQMSDDIAYRREGGRNILALAFPYTQ